MRIKDLQYTKQDTNTASPLDRCDNVTTDIAKHKQNIKASYHKYIRDPIYLATPRVLTGARTKN